MKSMNPTTLSSLEEANTGGPRVEAQKKQDPPKDLQQVQREFIERVARNLTETAISLVVGDRNASYDHPFNNMQRTASIQTGILGEVVTGGQVALNMIGMKLAREAYQHKADNLVDMIGYIIVYEVWRQVDEALRQQAAGKAGSDE